MLLRAICILVLSCILVAGLWPFHVPTNEVSWLSQGEGLFFGKYGSIVSAASFIVNPGRSGGSCSLEVWLKPRGVLSSGTILAFYQAQSQLPPFALRQSLGDLVLQRTTQNDSGKRKKIKIYVDDVLSHQNPVLVTIGSGESGTSVFTDGVLVKRIEGLKLSSRDLIGRLILGNSPVTTDDWSGQMKGLAIYDRELSPEDVSRHFADWTHGKASDLAQSEGALAVYRFDEGEGNVAHNLVDSATNLLIPERFFILHAPFLERPWDEFRPDLNYWKDVGINIGGFIPLGFFFYAYISLLRRTKRPVAITIACGFAISLVIEVSQAFLPTRDSGMTDLITNTLGTAVGVMVFRHKAVQTVLDGFCTKPILDSKR